MPNRGLSFGPLFRGDKSGGKKPSRFYPRNPLKSLDSDERIQGNPRNSNPQNRGLRSKTAGAQENPNRADLTERRARRRGRAKPALSKCEAVSRAGRDQSGRNVFDCHAVRISLLATVESALRR